MVGSGILSLRRGLKKGLGMGAGAVAELFPDLVERGYGTPTHVSPVGTIYVKLDATMGTSSHYLYTGTTTAWNPMSYDQE